MNKEDRIKRALWLVALCALAMIVAAGLAHAYWPRVLRVVGTGGFVAKEVKDAPHSFTVDKPRIWSDETGDFVRSGVTWDVALYGPSSSDNVLLASLIIRVRPTASQDAELPNPSGPIESLEDFIRIYLPREHEVSSEAATTVDGREARDLVYHYVFYGGSPHFPPTQARCRGRSVVFEDRGYYYMISYAWVDAEFDRYAEVFDHAVKSFRFLD